MVLQKEQEWTVFERPDLTERMPELERRYQQFNGDGKAITDSRYGNLIFTRYCSCGAITECRGKTDWTPEIGVRIKEIEEELESHSNTNSYGKVAELRKERKMLEQEFSYISHRVNQQVINAAAQTEIVSHDENCPSDGSTPTEIITLKSLSRTVSSVVVVLDSPDGDNVRVRRYDHRMFWDGKKLNNYRFSRGQFFFGVDGSISHAIMGKKTKSSFSFTKKKDAEKAAIDLGVAGMCDIHGSVVHVIADESVDGGAAWTRTGLKEYFESRDWESDYMSCNEMARLFGYMAYRSKQPTAELLVKAGFVSYLNESMMLQRDLKDSIAEEIRLPKSIIKNTQNFSFAEIQWLQLIHEAKPIKPEFLHFLLGNRHLMRNDRIQNLVVNYGFSPEDIMAYIDRAWASQAIGAANLLTIWRDTLRMAQDLGVEVQRFPKHLQRDHDVLARDYSMVVDQVLNKKYVDNIRNGLATAYRMKGKDLHIREPESLSEIHDEGRLLGHCVASYANNVAIGETTILFLRRNECPDEPFLTIEVKKGRFVQCRGKKNCHYLNLGDPKIGEFVDEWKKKKKITN